MVLEVTEHTAVASYGELIEWLAAYRARGALVAIDDAGAGYAGLQQILSLRPAFLKLDRALVEDIDHDECKRALVEAMGSFADRIDAWLIAEGIERRGELDVIARLGVPLAQGYLLGRPGPPWAAVPVDVADWLRSLGRPDDGSQLRHLIEVAPWLGEHDTGRAAQFLAGAHADEVIVVLDANRRPCGLLDAEHALVGDLLAVMTVSPATTVAAAARRALTRSPADRFRPLVCADGTGRYLGIVRLERIIDHLARRPEAEAAPAVPAGHRSER